jgi:DNA polymerase
VTCAAWLFDDDPQAGHWHIGTTGQGEWEPVPQSDDDVLDELVRRVRDGEPIEAHNAFFERMMWEQVWLRMLPWLPLPRPEQWHCSAAKAASFALPRKLEVLAQVLQVPEQKDMDGHRVMLKLARPARPTADNPDRQWWEDPRDIRRAWRYNIQDVRTEHACSRQMRPLSDFERQVWLLDQRMNRRGVRCDREMVGRAIDLADAEVIRLNADICELTGGAVKKGTSRPSLKKWVNAQGVELPGTTGKTIERVLDSEVMSREIERVLRMSLEVNKTSIKKYHSMLQRLCDDGLLRDLLIYCGASTGRWAGSGVQPHNFPRGGIKDIDVACEVISSGDRWAIEFLFGPVMEHLSHSIRGALTAREGRELIVADYAAVEARDVFWLAGDEAGLNDFRLSDAKEGPGVYCVMGEQIFGYPINKDDHPLERFAGKQAILGSGFGMGPDKFHETCLKYDVDLPMDICRRAIYTYRDVHEPVQRMWGEQEAAAKAAVAHPGRVFPCGRVSWAVRGRFLHCKLPSGRLLSYYKPRLSRMLNFRFKVLKPGRESDLSLNQDLRGGEGGALRRAAFRARAICKENRWKLVDEPPKMREQTVLRFEGMGKKWGLQETYGGKLVENITQAVARDQLAEAMVRIDAGGVYDMLLSVHDETIGEVDVGAGDLREFELEMARPPLWCPDAPLVAVGWRGVRYRKA